MVNSENPISAAVAAKECLSTCRVTPSNPALAQTRSNTFGRPTKWPSPRDAGNTQGQPSRIGCASISFTASAPIGRSCGPLLVSSKRMQRAWISTLERRSASASMRRKPVNSSRRITAKAVPFSPVISAWPMVWPSVPISSTLRKRRCFRSGGFFTPRAGFSLIILSEAFSVFQNCSQHPHGTGSSGRAAGRDATTSVARPSGLARDDVGFHALDIAGCQAPHRQTTKKRLDVRLDAASVQDPGRCLDAALGVSQVQLA